MSTYGVKQGWPSHRPRSTARSLKVAEKVDLNIKQLSHFDRKLDDIRLKVWPPLVYNNRYNFIIH